MMNKKLTTILLGTSIVALAALNPVSAEGNSNTPVKYKEIHFVTFQNGKPVDIKEPLKGDATSDLTHPQIDGYMYTTSRAGEDDQKGIFYHMYAPNTNNNVLAGGRQSNTGDTNSSTSGNSNQTSATSKIEWTIKDGKKYLKVDGKPASGLTTVEGKKYFFGIDGAAKVGVIEEGGKRFYFDAEGVQKTNWQKVGDKYYYFKEDGRYFYC